MDRLPAKQKATTQKKAALPNKSGAVCISAHLPLRWKVQEGLLYDFLGTCFMRHRGENTKRRRYIKTFLLRYIHPSHSLRVWVVMAQSRGS